MLHVKPSRVFVHSEHLVNAKLIALYLQEHRLTIHAKILIKNVQLKIMEVDAIITVIKHVVNLHLLNAQEIRKLRSAQLPHQLVVY